MGDNGTTRRELEHRAELKSITDKISKVMGMDRHDTYTLHSLMLQEFNARKLWITHMGIETPKEAS